MTRTRLQACADTAKRMHDNGQDLHRLEGAASIHEAVTPDENHMIGIFVERRAERAHPQV